MKTNFVDVLRRELEKPSWQGDYVAVGTATDCYQPIEGHYKLTRGALEALCEHRNPAGVVTKGPMVVRDKDIPVDLSAPRRLQRLHQRAVRGRGCLAAARAGHRAADAAAAGGPRARGCGRTRGVLMNPIVPVSRRGRP